MCTPTSSPSDGVAASVRRTRKQVRFEDDHLEERYELDISDQERKAKWMSRADFRAIHSDICQAVQESFVKRMPQDSSDDNDEDNEKCFRGLEAIISDCRKVQIQSFIQDMLEMQAEFAGPNGLQNFSENQSRPAMERARLMADHDATEARRVYAELLCAKRQ